MTQTKLDEPIAVVDTNVLVDLYSWHDTLDLYESASDALKTVESVEGRFRRARAREALLLGIYLHKIQATTFSLSEAVTKIGELVNPNAQGDAKTNFTRTFLYFVKEKLLTGWRDTMERSDARSNVADDKLLAYARGHRLPLITSEGYTPTGVSAKKGIRKKAKKSGGTVITAKQFYAGKINETEEANAFLARYRAECSAYVAKHGRPGRQIIRDMHGYYRHILFGETEGLSYRVAVEL